MGLKGLASVTNNGKGVFRGFSAFTLCDQRHCGEDSCCMNTDLVNSCESAERFASGRARLGNKLYLRLDQREVQAPSSSALYASILYEQSRPPQSHECS